MVLCVCILLINNSSLFNSLNPKAFRRYVNVMLSGELNCVNVRYSNEALIVKFSACGSVLLGALEVKIVVAKELQEEISAGSLKLAVHAA